MVVDWVWRMAKCWECLDSRNLCHWCSLPYTLDLVLSPSVESTANLPKIKKMTTTRERKQAIELACKKGKKEEDTYNTQGQRSLDNIDRSDDPAPN
jgi:hypothetical protein